MNLDEIGPSIKGGRVGGDMRYLALPRPRAWDDEDVPKGQPPLPHPQVFVGEPVDTGLIDKDGTSIYRLPDRIGFLRVKEDRQ